MVTGPRAAKLLGQLEQLGLAIQLLLESQRIQVPIEREHEAAELQSRTVEHPPSMSQAVGLHLGGKVDEVQVETLKSIGQGQFDDFAGTPETPNASTFRFLNIVWFLSAASGARLSGGKEFVEGRPLIMPNSSSASKRRSRLRSPECELPSANR